MASIMSPPNRRKLALSALIVVLGLLAYGAVLDRLLALPGFRKLDEKGEAYYHTTLRRSAYTYGVVRGINGLISVIQETEVAVSPAGVGVSLALGEFVDPVNDLTERFSWVMLVATTALGVQTFLMDVGAWAGLRFLLPPALLLLLAGIWRRRWGRFDCRDIGTRLVVFAVLIRFCLPAVALVSEAVYNRFLADEYETSIQSLEMVNRQIEDVDLLQKTDDQGVFSRIMASAKIRKTIAALKEKLSDYASFMLTLMTIFLIQTVILPIFFLWLFIRLMGRLFGRHPPRLPLPS